ncbi:hypothetical protein AYO21_09872 [Fonsecaea monophora]|uniref:FAS1 domain-containing protein n=3 Tax=Fonsecaea TaxID=40354 RepID=A0A0D2G0T6_9EURO|nr:uncharacterized protein Z517_12328 [Fonsecaea pedrosoi CBS 271.37]XP_022504161.1 hypothetical protein AYO20_01467 [Fonsecaea nubica]XP_022507897.1 hypothetical protein AYO21_09872 [Fonsecaea monophora]KAH0848768.1 hypothetical protein FOPE_03192 [Fonsecaea pedrosoi]KIW74388.1 hypothetical protein Z517_12328 [Fonsecaea pedrosoi CBS 271.37]OAG35945.1 hypothetical protein AYO21_09872 [Fonsecaea monophora]OAL39149.1 hypothetical protein AYO20_01467 [Fonsecaea nubica]
MIGLRKAFVFSTLLLGTLSSPAHVPEDDHALINWEAFQSLLDTVDPAALHSVLHSLSPKFQDGVFSKDRAAIEHVHSENPIIASKLVHLAKKRQDSNSTTTATTTPSTDAQSSVASESSSRAASVSSILSSAIFASTVPGATTVTVPPTTPPSATPVETSGDAVVFSTFGGGLVTLTSSALSVHFTPSTSTQLFYATAGDGSVQTSTSVVVVNAPVTDSGDATGAAGAATTTGSPGLQNGGVSIKMGGLASIFAGLGGLLFLAL